MQAREKRLRAAKLPYAVCFSSPASFTLNVHGAYYIVSQNVAGFAFWL